MAHLEAAPILENREVAPLHFQMILKSPRIAREAKPGQFVHIRCGNEFEPLLRRPFSFLRIRKSEGIIEILYKTVGVGTELLSLANPGDSLDILGPLGKTFDVGPDKKHILLAGAGVGIPPMVAVAEGLKSADSQTGSALPIREIIPILAGRTKELVICIDDFQKIGLGPEIATDDGSLGEKGLITDRLAGIIKKRGFDKAASETMILGCGPQPMLNAVAELSFKFQIACQLSVEEKMGCAIGACLACVIPTVHGPSRVCCDGTVYDSREILWDKYAHA